MGIQVKYSNLCEEMKAEIIEANACSDHIHMLVSVPPYLRQYRTMTT